MVISDNIFAMLLVESYFQTFNKKPVGDAKTSTEVLIALDAGTKEEVEQTMVKAKELGETSYAEAQENGWVDTDSFASLAGQQWEVAFIDAKQFTGPE